MKRELFVLSIVFALPAFFIMGACGGRTNGDYPIQPVPFTNVDIQDSFWLPRLKVNREVTIPYAFRMCEETGRIANFARAGGLEEGGHEGLYFNDSDVYKVIEGAAYSLALFPDPDLEKYVDRVIDQIAAAQEEDGYLYTARTLQTDDKLPPGGKERWSHIEHGHELYCAGHLYEAAVAYYQATGKKELLDVAVKNADFIAALFNPEGMRNPPGHQEIEIGLGKLYRLTGDRKYLDLAKFFLDERGRSEGHDLYGEYSQDHIPVVEQREAVGHAVRAAYMYSGMADIAALTGSGKYIDAIGRIWEDVVGRKMYITGGIGATGGNEGFSVPYELPNRTAYSKTCASIANAMWNHRMFLLHGDSRYMDVVERVIYNAFLSGVGMEGDRFFYPNRLESLTGAERSPWFDCACCPSNIVRFIPSLPGYVYAKKGNGVFVNLFIGSRARIELDHFTLSLTQETEYPWNGDVTITVDPGRKERKFALFLRIPGWAQEKPVPGDLYRYMSGRISEIRVFINGQPADPVMRNGYVRLERTWTPGDIVQLDIPMPVRRVVAHEAVEADRGRTALERGPLVYAVEGLDVEQGLVHNLLFPDDSVPAVEVRKDLLGGIHTIHALAFAGREKVMFSAIPYYAWAHRGLTEMAVWLVREDAAVRLEIKSQEGSRFP
ncbi:MAG: glycoside hydrolase family 127 protein [Acidobacteriota bacterium]